MEHHDLLSGLVRLHILHHAAQHPVYGQWMIDELAPDGYLIGQTARDGRTSRKYYTITEKGREGLAVARVRLRELEGEARAE